MIPEFFPEDRYVNIDGLNNKAHGMLQSAVEIVDGKPRIKEVNFEILYQGTVKSTILFACNTFFEPRFTFDVVPLTSPVTQNAFQPIYVYAYPEEDGKMNIIIYTERKFHERIRLIKESSIFKEGFLNIEYFLFWMLEDTRKIFSEKRLNELV